jgi:hypothetical protein
VVWLSVSSTGQCNMQISAHVYNIIFLWGKSPIILEWQQYLFFCWQILTVIWGSFSISDQFNMQIRAHVYNRIFFKGYKSHNTGTTKNENQLSKRKQTVKPPLFVMI